MRPRHFVVVDVKRRTPAFEPAVHVGNANLNVVGDAFDEPAAYYKKGARRKTVRREPLRPAVIAATGVPNELQSAIRRNKHTLERSHETQININIRFKGIQMVMYVMRKPSRHLPAASWSEAALRSHSGEV